MSDTTPAAAPSSLERKRKDERSAIHAATARPAAVTTASGHRLGSSGLRGRSISDGIGCQTLAAREELTE